MQRTDLPTLTSRLGELAEVLPPHRVPSDRAVLVWFDQLKTFSTSEVLNAITDWPRKHTRMPAPADLVGLLEERRSTRIEEEAKAAAREPGFRPAALRPGPTDEGRRYLAAIHAVLAAPRPDPRAWIGRVARREADGDTTLCDHAHRLWRAAAGVPGDVSADDFIARKPRALPAPSIAHDDDEVFA